VTDDNIADMRRLASEREGRINELLDQVQALQGQIQAERRWRLAAEFDAAGAHKALRKLRKVLRKVLRKTYLAAVEAEA
jgi:hypothetical protein